jgi:hypothetical protein
VLSGASLRCACCCVMSCAAWHSTPWHCQHTATGTQQHALAAADIASQQHTPSSASILASRAASRDKLACRCCSTCGASFLLLLGHRCVVPAAVSCRAPWLSAPWRCQHTATGTQQHAVAAADIASQQHKPSSTSISASRAASRDKLACRCCSICGASFLLSLRCLWC